MKLKQMEADRNMRLFQSVVLFLVSLVAGLVTTATAGSGCIQETICLRVVSQKWMNNDELRRLTPSPRKSSVRLRLSNSGKDEIVYLTSLDSVVPVGFRLSKQKEGDDLKFSSEAKDRTESALRTRLGGSLKYLRLPPNSVVEFEVPDWGNPVRDEEDTRHAFSIFIRLGEINGSDLPIELISEAFAPLKK